MLRALAGRLPAHQASEQSTDEQEDREGLGLGPTGQDVSQEQGRLLVLSFTTLSVSSAAKLPCYR